MYLRLFNLLEDECHKFDLEVVELTTPQTGDRPSFTNYKKVIERERELLDELECMEGQLKWLEQTLTLTSLNSSNPSTDPQVHMLVNLIKERKKRVLEILRYIHTQIGIVVIVTACNTFERNQSLLPSPRRHSTGKMVLL